MDWGASAGVSAAMRSIWTSMSRAWPAARRSFLSRRRDLRAGLSCGGKAGRSSSSMSWASMRRVVVRRRWTGLGAGSARQRVMAASRAVTCSRRVRMGCAMVEVAMGVGCYVLRRWLIVAGGERAEIRVYSFVDRGISLALTGMGLYQGLNRSGSSKGIGGTCEEKGHVVGCSGGRFAYGTDGVDAAEDCG